LNEWLFNQILFTDKKSGSFFNDHGLKWPHYSFFQQRFGFWKQLSKIFGKFWTFWSFPKKMMKAIFRLFNVIRQMLLSCLIGYMPLFSRALPLILFVYLPCNLQSTMIFCRLLIN
jgi:hypothetical protein